MSWRADSARCNAMLCSHGSRSASVRATPLVIVSMFAGGWSRSPSRNENPSRSASPRAIVLFPVPETPITTTVAGSCGSSGSRWCVRWDPSPVSPLFCAVTALLVTKPSPRPCAQVSGGFELTIHWCAHATQGILPIGAQSERSGSIRWPPTRRCPTLTLPLLSPRWVVGVAAAQRPDRRTTLADSEQACRRCWFDPAAMWTGSATVPVSWTVWSASLFGLPGKKVRHEPIEVLGALDRHHV